MNDKSIIIIGAGGHSKVVLSTIIASGKKVAGFVDDNTALRGTSILGHKVIGNLSLLEDRKGQDAVLAIGNNKLRQKLALKFTDLNWVTIKHPQSYVHESVSLGKGTVVFAGAIVQPEVTIGNHVIINTAATIDHECMIHDFVHLAPATHLAGNVEIKEGTFIGMGSNVIASICIGQWVTVGAGSIVVSVLDDYVHAKGLPAKVYKTLG